MNLYIRVIVGNHYLDHFLIRLNNICHQYKMTIVENNYKPYWKDNACYEMDICLSPCPHINYNEWIEFYLCLFHQGYIIEENSFDFTEGPAVIFANYPRLYELSNTNIEKSFVLLYVPQKCISNYHSINSLRS